MARWGCRCHVVASRANAQHFAWFQVPWFSSQFWTNIVHSLGVHLSYYFLFSFPFYNIIAYCLDFHLLGLGSLLCLLLLQLLDLIGVVLGPLVPLVRSLAGLGHLFEDGVFLVGLGCEGGILAGKGDLEVFDIACVCLKGAVLVIEDTQGWNKEEVVSE